jgi:two-component system chemotaxis sensor kinase CheA
MVILQDVTRFRMLKDEADRNRAWQESVVKVLQNRETYDEFNRDALALLNQSRADVAAMAAADPERVGSLFRAMHTLKGTAALFGLDGAAELAHAAENLLSDLRANPHQALGADKRTALLDGILKLEAELTSARIRMESLLGDVAGEPSVSVTHSKLEKVERQLVPLVPVSRQVLARTMLESLLHIPAPRLLRKYASLVAATGAKLGKSAQLKIEDPDGTELSMDLFKQVDPALLHIIRNAIDHGIESPDEREQAGKDPQASITITCRTYRGGIGFTITDDGRGIDVERVRQVAVERGFLAPAEAARASAQEVVKLIFAPGFSSTESVTDLSGRGVGMDAVKTSIEAMHGRLRLETRKGKGTTIELMYPHSHAYRLAG